MLVPVRLPPGPVLGRRSDLVGRRTQGEEPGRTSLQSFPNRPGEVDPCDESKVVPPLPVRSGTSSLVRTHGSPSHHTPRRRRPVSQGPTVDCHTDIFLRQG